jgi:hypothetical protein
VTISDRRSTWDGDKEINDEEVVEKACCQKSCEDLNGKENRQEEFHGKEGHQESCQKKWGRT